MVVFIRINKTGSTSLKNWLETSKTKFIRHQYRYGKEKLYECIKKHKKTHKFVTVVRNPYSRAVSCWKFLFPDISFLDFLNKDYNTMTEFEQFHVLPQYRFITDINDSIDYIDHIGRLEDIKPTMNYIIDNGYHDLKNVDFPNKRRTTHEHYTKYYNKKVYDLVSTKYKRDIDMFKYEF